MENQFQTSTPTKNDEGCSEDDISDGGLEIVVDSPRVKKKRTRKTKPLEINIEEKELIASVEEEIEKTLGEKAAKFNCSAVNVKNLIKNVITNEHVLAMVKHVEDPQAESGELSLFEPKLTRAKAKELSKTQNIPWISPKLPSSEVQVLMSEELHESDEDDEYVPESEDDRETTASDFESSLPPTPSQDAEPSEQTETAFTEDGVFKIPPIKSQQTEEDTNIALRTRSKFSLSHTPLEVIEEAFMPPDITTDMYDLECGDEDWADFIKTFTRPLDEVMKVAEDEDHDPEYNILADLAENEEDKEELRADKAVKITRKELNELISELCEFETELSGEFRRTPEPNPHESISTPPNIQLPEKSNWSASPHKTYHTLQNMQFDSPPKDGERPVFTSTPCPSSVLPSSFEGTQTEFQPAYNVEIVINSNTINEDQKLVIEQQMRQHVQLLTQNFILCYDNEYEDVAAKCKEYLENLKTLGQESQFSFHNAVNLKPALKLVEDWEKKIKSRDIEVKLMKDFYEYEANKHHHYRSTGQTYQMKFPELIFKTIANSSVFIYPSLLPLYPFPQKTSAFRHVPMLPSEIELMALGLEQFTSFLEEDKSQPRNNDGVVSIRSVLRHIQIYMLPCRSVSVLNRTFISLKKELSDNPVKHYLQHKTAPDFTHYVYPIQQLGILPPKLRNLDDLPDVWKNQFLSLNDSLNSSSGSFQTIRKVQKPPVFNKNLLGRSPKKKRQIVHNSFKKSKKREIGLPEERPRDSTGKFLPKSKSSPFPVFHTGKKLSNYYRDSECNAQITRQINNLRFNSSIFNRTRKKWVEVEEISVSCPDTTCDNFDMLPSMPAIGSLSNKSNQTISIENVQQVEEDVQCVPPEEKINEVSTTIEGEDEDVSEKDNIEDINALMVASSTIKNIQKKALTGSEKKKLRLRRDFISNITLLSPEDPAVVLEKANSYVQAFYDKVQERLEVHEYHQFMQVLNNFDYRVSSTATLYEQVCKILQPKYSDLADEFLTFLTPAEAKTIGKPRPHFMLRNMSLFLHKLGIYFKDQPSQLRKVYRSLTELASCVDASMEMVKASILPLLKGNTLLTDWFLQIFPGERPPESLVNGPWETVDVSREPSCLNGNEEIIETVVIPDFEDQYGGLHCICDCHNSEQPTLKLKHQHCMPCGKKFLQGRIYVQTGKGLRLAHVTFDSNREEHVKRLCGPTLVTAVKKRSEISPTKQASPMKEKDSQDESDDEDRKKPKGKTPKKRKIKVTEKAERPLKKTKQSKNEVKVDKEEVIAEPLVEEPPLQEEPSESKVNNNTSDSSVEQKPAEEGPEWDCNTSIESIDLRLSPEPSAGSESEIYEESSQDNINSDCEESEDDAVSLTQSPTPHSENSNSNLFEEVSWTRDEDKVVLLTLREMGHNDDAISHIAKQLEGKTEEQIKTRFLKLLSLLQEMAASDSKDE